MKIHFFIFAILVIFWSFSLYFYIHSLLFSAGEWLKITFSLTLILIYEIFCFIITLSNLPFKRFKILLIVLAIFCSALILAIFFNENLGSYLMALSHQGAIFLLLLFIYAGLGGAILFEKSLEVSALSHLRAIYTLVGFGVFIVAIAVLYIFLPLITERVYFWLGPVFAFLFLFSSSFGYYLTQEAEKRKEAERLVGEWEKLALAKDQFLLALQHHLRTPLTPLKGYLERILEGTYGRVENPIIKEKLIEMKKLVNTLYSLMESLLDVQGLRMGKKILNLESVQIENLIEGIIEELKPEAEQKGLYLKYEKIPLPAIKLDKKRIREAIWNLVDNAIKYTNKGEINIKLQITNNKLQIMVADTGIGMEKEEIDYFLEGKLFERGEEAKKLYGPGRGIGLTIALEFIKAHGGKIWAESKGRGKGTTFWIELPLNGK